MTKHISITLLLFNFFVGNAQEKTAEIPLSDGLKVIDFRFHQNGSFSVFKQGKKKETSKYTLLDENLEMVTYTSEEKMKVPSQTQTAGNQMTWGDANGSSIQPMYFSPTGKNILYKNSRNYFLWNANEVEFTEADINGDIEENPKVKFTDIDRPQDFVSKEFMTDTHFFSIGRKEGATNFNKGYYANMAIFLYRKNLETLEEDYLKLQIPDDCCFFTVIDPKLLYFDEDIFILSYALRQNGQTNKKLKWFRPKPEEQTKKYRVVTYNHSAEVLSDRVIDITRPENTDAFGLTNLGDTSFYYRQTLGPGGRSSVETIPATESMAQLSYGKEEDAFYVHSVLKLEEKDDAFMLQKFDATGKLVWNTYQELPGFNLHNFNMQHMRLLVDITKSFVGVSLYSYSSQDHNKFFVLDKNTGEILAKKEFGRHDNKRVLRFLKTKTNRYSAMILKDEFSEKLTLDKNTFLACLYDTDYKEFVKELALSDERFSLLSYFTTNGITTVAKPENNEKLQFYQFALEKNDN